MALRRFVLAAGVVTLAACEPALPVIGVGQGYPATRMETHIDSYKALRRLPRLLRDRMPGKNTVSNDTPRDEITR